MSDQKHNISISGSNIQGGINNIGGQQNFQGPVTISLDHLTASIKGMSPADEEKAKLQALLIAELETALSQVPAEQQVDAAKIAKRAKQVVESCPTNR